MNFIKKAIFGLIKKMKFLPPAFYMKIYYEYYTGKKLDLKSPKEFNEKIQWLKVYYKPTILTQLVDKVAVREHIEKTIGAKYLSPLIGVYDSYEAIDFDGLPDQFVIKGSHGSNYNLIVKDKNSLKKSTAKHLIKKWLRRNYYYRSGLEWAYKNVPPRIIIEHFMEDTRYHELMDFKFYCFNGQPGLIQLDLGRPLNHTRKFYDITWKALDIKKGTIPFHHEEIDAPENLGEMVQLATKLSTPFPFARIDFYSVNGKSVFGEITFYPGDGRTEFYPNEYNRIFGDHISLPDLKPGEKGIFSTT